MTTTNDTAALKRQCARLRRENSRMRSIILYMAAQFVNATILKPKKARHDRR